MVIQRITKTGINTVSLKGVGYLHLNRNIFNLFFS